MEFDEIHVTTFHTVHRVLKARKLKWLVIPFSRRSSKKDLNDSYNYDDAINHPAPELQECEIKWALGSTTMNKATEGDGIQPSYFKS